MLSREIIVVQVQPVLYANNILRGVVFLFSTGF